MDRYEYLQSLIQRFEEASIRKSGGKTKAVIHFVPDYVNCNRSLAPDGHYWFNVTMTHRGWQIYYSYTSGEFIHIGGMIGNTIEETIEFLEGHFEKFGE